MTSQIAVFNSLGVAVASDTVTTHGIGQSAKTTNNAEKIYPLQHPHLVVVIHSGAVRINWINSQNFITEWSRATQNALPTIADYPRSLVQWISEDERLINPQSEIELIKRVLNDHYSEVFQRTRALAERENEPLAVSDALLTASQSGLEYLQQLPNFGNCTDEQDQALLTSSDIDLDEILKSWFEELDGFDAAKGILCQSAPLVLSRQQHMPFDSEFGIIGFGADDYFAKSVRVRIRGRYGNFVRCIIQEEFGTGNNFTSGSIAFFAQFEAMAGFLRGAHHSLIDEIIAQAWEEIYLALDPPIDEEVANKVSEKLRAFVNEFQGREFQGPMLETIGGISLPGLAELAESLVGMQATYAVAAGKGVTTVGGFIESLTIDRAHGIRWVKRLPNAAI
jgi:hypothetical protein